MTNQATDLLKAVNDVTVALDSSAEPQPDMLSAINLLVDKLNAFMEANIGDGKVTADKLAADIQRLLVFTGVDASEAAADATLTGAKAGDVVVGVVNLTDAAAATSLFETVISTDDKISQLSTDLSAKTLFVLLIAKGD